MIVDNNRNIVSDHAFPSRLMHQGICEAGGVGVRPWTLNTDVTHVPLGS